VRSSPTRRFLLSVGVMATTAMTRADPAVRTDAGLLRGAAPDARGVTAFKGIPYATPPVGPLRWRAPQPATPWRDVRDAVRFGAPCWAAIAPGPARPGATPPSEDCLTINVWTPAPHAGAAKPVMVWLHDGGFEFGSSAQPGYDGSRLAARGVVVVSLNYRLGVFGFLAHPALDAEAPGSGAYGLQDQVAALRWVQRNIAAFGGDPQHVTLFGESAGAHAVGILMASQQTRGLFTKAIAQSGAFWDSEHGSIATHDEALARGRALAPKLGVQTVAELRAVPADRLNTATSWDFTSDPGVTAFAPSVDGQLLRESPAATFARGGQLDVPLLGGWNAAEDVAFRSRALPHATPAAFADAARQLFGADRMGEFAALYPARDSDQARASAFALVGDLVISEQTWEMLGLHRQTRRSAVYAYQFAHRSSYSPVASHAADPVFVFGTLTPQFFAPQAPPPDEVDRQVSELMMAYWTNFATRGDPNGAGLPVWPVYEGPGSSVMHLQAGAAAGPERDTDRLRFVASFRREGRLPESWRVLGGS